VSEIAEAVLDSSVIAALFFNDPCSESAERFVLGLGTAYTLDLAVAEVSNVAWKRIKFFGEDYGKVKELLKMAVRFIDEVCVSFSSREIYEEALAIGVEISESVYDALFIALAEKLKVKLATCDEKLGNKLKNTRLREAVLVLKPGNPLNIEHPPRATSTSSQL